MEVQDTITQLPLQIDPQTKAISISTSSVPTATMTTTKGLQDELDQLNTLNRSLLKLETPNSVPPAPVPVDPKRSAQVAKLRESGNTSFRKGEHEEAIRMYTLAIEMALTRHGWEPAGLVREEASGLYANRAQAHMAMQSWPEGAVDAESSTELKRAGNAKGWWRRAKCLLEMGRLEEARQAVTRGLEFEGGEQDLVALRKDIDAAMQRRGL